MAATICISGQTHSNKIVLIVPRQGYVKKFSQKSYSRQRVLDVDSRTLNSQIGRGPESDFCLQFGGYCGYTPGNIPMFPGCKVVGKKSGQNAQLRWNSGGKPERSLPRLMDFPEISWPSVIKTMRNWVLANIIIKPYFDNEFRISDFIYGSKQAVECVSNHLANGEHTLLDDLVTSDALQEVKRNVSFFTQQQRQNLHVDKDDIYFSFPYQIGIMFNDDERNQQRFVEITMVYHVLQGLKDMQDEGISPPVNLGLMPQYQDRLQICNYRFIREFTKGVNGPWTINVINHFKPVDLARA